MTVAPQSFPSGKTGPAWFDPQADMMFPDGRVYRVPLFRICQHGSGNTRELPGCYCEVEVIEVGQQDPMFFRVHFLPSVFKNGVVGESHYSVLLAARDWVHTYLTHNRRAPSELNCEAPISFWFR